MTGAPTDQTDKTLRALLADVFKVAPRAIGPATAFGDIPAWDSLGHIALMARLEGEFGLAVSAQTIGQLVSFQAIADYLRTRGARPTLGAGAAQRTEVLEDFSGRPGVFFKDPMPGLLARGEVFEEGVGMYALGPLPTRLIAYMQGRIHAISQEFGAVPYRFPALISAKSLDRVGYFQAFPQFLTFACHLRDDEAVVKRFSRDAKCGDDGMNTPPAAYARARAALSPATCYHLYFGLADRRLPKAGLTATAVGNCFRFESGRLSTLERMWNFSMQEIIFAGARDFVLARREKVRLAVFAVLRDMELAYSVETANDPFFLGDDKQAAFQDAFQLKYEIRASLPFKKSTLAVGSYNYHQDHFGRALGITLSRGAAAHTGCAAFGLERMAYAFFAQKGLDPKRWPRAVRKALT